MKYTQNYGVFTMPKGRTQQSFELKNRMKGAFFLDTLKF